MGEGWRVQEVEGGEEEGRGGREEKGEGRVKKRRRTAQGEGGDVEVFCGAASNFFLKNGNLYGWGDNKYGQLGVEVEGKGEEGGSSKEEDEMKGVKGVDMVPSPVFLLDNVKKVSCSASHSLFLMRNGDVFASGLNSRGELGTADRVSRTSMIRVPFPEGVEVEDAASSLWSSSFILKFSEEKVEGGEGKACVRQVWSTINLPFLASHPFSPGREEGNGGRTQMVYREETKSFEVASLPDEFTQVEWRLMKEVEKVRSSNPAARVLCAPFPEPWGPPFPLSTSSSEVEGGLNFVAFLDGKQVVLRGDLRQFERSEGKGGEGEEGRGGEEGEEGRGEEGIGGTGKRDIDSEENENMLIGNEDEIREHLMKEGRLEVGCGSTFCVFW